MGIKNTCLFLPKIFSHTLADFLDLIIGYPQSLLKTGDFLGVILLFYLVI